MFKHKLITLGLATIGVATTGSIAVAAIPGSASGTCSRRPQ
jgi:hypothetical protein